MGLVLKMPQLCLLLFLFSWTTPSQETEAPGACVKIDPKTMEETAAKSMTESDILTEMAEAATKNPGATKTIKGIKGLKVQEIQPPNMTVNCIKDVGIVIKVISQLTIAGKSFIGGKMEITIRSCMITKSKMEVIGPKELKFEVIDCSVELLSCKTNLPSSMLPKIVNKFLNSTLAKVLPNMMCPAADKVVGVMKEKMLSVFAPCSCDHGVVMQYLLKNNLEKEAEYIGIHFSTHQTSVGVSEHELRNLINGYGKEFSLSDDLEDFCTLIQKNGKTIDIPLDPPASTNLPPKREGSTIVYIPVNIMNGAMIALNEVFNVKVTAAPDGKEMTAQLTGTANPTYALEKDKGTLTLPIQMEVPEEGLVVRMVIVVRTTFAVIKEKLNTTIELDSMNDVDQISGSADESTLSELVKAAVSSWKDKFPSLCLPSLLGGSYGNAPAEIIQDNLALYVEVK